jgi:hypothetical protein
VNEARNASLLAHKVTGLDIPANAWRPQANGRYTAKMPDMPRELTYRHKEGRPCVLVDATWLICCRLEFERAMTRGWPKGHSPDCEDQGTTQEMPS